MKIGDYVRTKQKGFQPPQIAKIKSMKRDAGYNNQYYIELDHNLIPDYNFYIYEEDIEKTSPNIIDLIEVGDYVNGCWVNEIKDGKPYHEDYNDPYYSYYIENEEIKSVVTHEQFENISYKVGE